MMKASVKARYETEKAASATGGATIAFNAGDFKLRASMTDATIVNGPSLNGLALGVEKPGSFIFDYNVPQKWQTQDLEGVVGARKVEHTY
ncbi:outer envelope pore protein 24B, chloroplastic-like isoform X1 [Capsicum annuum]|uniref:outer envelope pore protein 24B, chloroplastic-like isoform X1 n=1 Tax=Capsicum annuum TaxID=4072 RepID=UPI001FB072C1|nr:outer envelope pore protein 24B, chloroplastic-like isoform X1 [Capsicum annuum]